MSPWWNPFGRPSEAPAEPSYRIPLCPTSVDGGTCTCGEKTPAVAPPARVIWTMEFEGRLVEDEEFGEPLEFSDEEVRRAQEVLKSIELFDFIDSIRPRPRKTHKAMYRAWAHRLITAA